MMMLVRLWHHYIGFLIAPSVLFFALTGSLQLFSLHEAHGDYQPPALIAKLSNVHKNQAFRANPTRAASGSRRRPAEDTDAPANAVAVSNAAEPSLAASNAAAPRHHHHDADAATNAAAAPTSTAAAAPAAQPEQPSAAQAGDGRAPKLGTLLLKWYFLAVALGLVTSTCLGLWIGFTHVRRRWVALALFVAGAVIPIALIVL